MHYMIDELESFCCGKVETLLVKLKKFMSKEKLIEIKLVIIKQKIEIKVVVPLFRMCLNYSCI